MSVNDNCYIYDEPVKYKNLLIYPATMRDYFNFSVSVGSLLIDKDSIPDVKVISMTYLEFLYYSHTNSIGEYDSLLLLNYLFRICFKLDENSKLDFVYKDDKPYFVVDGEFYNADDFDKIKAIICEQNDVEMIDDSMSKELRDMIEKARKAKSRMSNFNICSIEDQMICIAAFYHYTMEQVYNLTIRKFKKMLKRADKMIHYPVYLMMSASCEIKDKSILSHWMSDLDGGRYDDILIDAGTFEQKLNSSM